jgi:transcriptional regulator
MYTPASFRVADAPTLHTFLERHSFATLISQAGDEPVASHLPLLLERDAGENGRLIGHMARANPHWKSAAGTQVLAMFHGPHAYISPTWYEANDTVPTWNYAAVHAYGVLTLIEDEPRLREIVERTVQVYEAGMPRPWSMESVDPAFVDKMLLGIVGFEIVIDRLEGKWKLNQNHPVERREKVVHGLEATGRVDDAAVAGLMREQLRSERPS